jgi:hypothetical protein
MRIYREEGGEEGGYSGQSRVEEIQGKGEQMEKGYTK